MDLPIPDKQGAIANLNHKTLSQFEPGTIVTLSASGHSSSEFLDFLNSRNLKLGTEIKIISKEPYDGSVIISYAGQTGEALSAMVCERLLVEKV